MASGTSDLIPALSTTTPLAGGQVVITEKVIAGQYSSITILGYSDTATLVFVEFSGDGVNWDVAVQKSFSALQGGTQSTVILSKWMRLRVENNSGVGQTVLRIHTYANIQNTSIKASLAPINNIAPAVNVANLPTSGNVMMVESPVSIFSNSMYHGEFLANINDVTWTPGDFIDCGGCQMRIINLVALGAEPNTNAEWVPEGVGTGYKLSVNSASTNVVRVGIQSSRISNPDCRGVVIFTGTAAWEPNPRVSRHRELLGLVSGRSFVEADPCVAVGSYSASFLDNINEFEIIYHQSITDPVITIPQSQWNLDKADGTQNLPNMSLISGNTGVKIILDHSGSGICFVQLQHPETGGWVTVHVISNSGFRPLFRSQGFAAFAYVSNELDLVSGETKNIFLRYMEMQQTAAGLVNVPSRLDTHRMKFVPGTQSIAPGNQDIITFRCSDLDTNFGNARNRMTCLLSRVLHMVRTGGENQVNDFLEITVYTIQPSQVQERIGFPWIRISDRSPMEYAEFPIILGGGSTKRKLYRAPVSTFRNNHPLQTDPSPFTADSVSQGSSPTSTELVFPPGFIVVVEISNPENIVDVEGYFGFEFISGV